LCDIEPALEGINKISIAGKLAWVNLFYFVRDTVTKEATWLVKFVCLLLAYSQTPLAQIANDLT
jgi:hypothetical protein